MHHVEAFGSSTGSNISSSGNINNYNPKLPTPNHRTVLTIGNYRLGRTLGVGSFGKVKGMLLHLLFISDFLILLYFSCGTYLH
jgi:hypothetical protein